MKSQLSNVIAVSSLILASFSCGSIKDSRTKFESNNDSASKDSKTSSEVSISIGMESNEITQLSLGTIANTAMRARLECTGLSKENADSKFTVPVGSKGCKVRLLSFQISSGGEYTVSKDFANLNKGDTAEFRSAISSRYAIVTIVAQIPDPIAADAAVTFKAAEIINGGNIAVSKDGTVTLSSTTDMVSNVYPNKASILASGKLRVEFRCGDGDVLGTSLATATCYGEKLSDHQVLVDISPSLLDMPTLSALFASKGKTFADLNATIEVLPYQETFRKMVVVEVPFNVADKSNRIIGVKIKDAIRYRIVTGIQ